MSTSSTMTAAPAKLTGHSQAKNTTTANTKAQTEKILVLAVGRKKDGRIFVTPIDIEHEHDDQSAVTTDEATLKATAQKYLFDHEEEFQKGLSHLYDIFSGRLYRGSFRTLENYCFALYGMNRVEPAKVTKAREQVKQIQQTGT